MSRVKNYNVSIRELDNRVIFLRKLKREEASTASASMLHGWQACRKAW
ncbi:MAG: hypothetical protein MZV63_56990 [Marinilabiliales bacterium]|nr:hypothetical protein [Marinilabiliales bacterium]